jgi:hypothetical protein
MKIKPVFLFFSCCIGVIFHLGGIVWLNHQPLSFQQHSFENSVAGRQEAYEVWERQKRSDMLAAVFSGLAEEKPIVKQELHELKAEYAPDLDLAFQTETSFDLSSKDFSFENHYLERVPSLPEGLAGCEKDSGASLIAPLPSLSKIKLPPLADLDFDKGIIEGVETLASSEHFDISVEYAPKRNRPGFVFKITLLPHRDVHFKRIRQNFFFLVDRSNSIPRARYALNKKAVAGALDYLQPGDRFNILIFDDHVVHFCSKEVEWSEATVALARDFLDAQGHGGYFAATELYVSLGKIIPQDVAEDEINIAILVSDGDTYLSQEKQRLTIGGWTAKNKGKVALYTLASGTGNNLPLLELLSSFNKGALIYAPDHQGVSERLSYLMRTLQHPIGKQMVATAVPEDKGMTVLLQPKASRIPDLYKNKPFVIYGTTNKLSDFVLFLQGKYYDRHFDIKKRISFEYANLDPYSVERAWTQLVAQEFYERYFEEGNQAHLEAAKQLLVPLNLPMPLIE